MQQALDKIIFLVGNPEDLEKIENVPALPVYSDRMMRFLAALSSELLRDKKAKRMTDVASYAYWIRSASLSRAKSECSNVSDRVGRGVTFHIAPSNVPVNFAVSMTSALLAGNAVMIRVSDKRFEQTELICEAINHLLEEDFKDLRSYIFIFRYGHDAEVTGVLSSMCDVRIIWGGDNTIREIRRAELPPRSIELTFADRHSVAVIDSEYYLTCDPGKTARDFYTDTYYTDQNACSSPRIVVWIGEKKREARERFWVELRKLVEKEYDLKPVQSVDKYSAFCALVMEHDGVRLTEDSDNYLMRAEVDDLYRGIMDHKQSGGYFFEYEAKDLSEIVPILGKRCQTVAVLGIEKEEIKKLVFENGVRGVDRIVDLGQTMGLEFVWDGVHMVEAMSRIVYTLRSE